MNKMTVMRTAKQEWGGNDSDKPEGNSARAHDARLGVLERAEQLLLLELLLLLPEESSRKLAILLRRGHLLVVESINLKFLDHCLEVVLDSLFGGRDGRRDWLLLDGRRCEWVSGGKSLDGSGGCCGRCGKAIHAWLRSDTIRLGLPDLLRLLEHGLVDGELDSLSGWPRTQVVHARLQALLPSVEVHARELTNTGGLQVDVQALTLANEGTTVGSEVEDLLLADLPDCLVDRLDVVGDAVDALDRPVVGDDHVLHLVIPELQVDELAKQPRADNLELAGENATGVDVAGVRLETFVVTEDLARRGGRHGSKEKGVPETSARHLLLERGPVPEVGRSYTPQVVLKLTLACRASLVRLVGPIDLSHVATGLNGCVVDGLEDLLVKDACFRRVEGHAQSHESIRETLHTDTDGAVTHVRATCFRDGVVVDVDDAVEVERDNLGNVMQLLEVVDPILDERREGDGGEVADGGLVRRRILDNLSTQVR